jgi:hypothetical protein
MNNNMINLKDINNMNKFNNQQNLMIITKKILDLVE